MQKLMGDEGWGGLFFSTDPKWLWSLLGRLYNVYILIQTCYFTDILLYWYVVNIGQAIQCLYFNTDMLFY